MRYVAAYLLALAGGNHSPKLDDIKNILGAVGVDTDAEAANLVISRLQGKNIEEVIADGAPALVTMSGGVPPASAPVAAVEAVPAAAAAPTETKPAKKEEKEESDDDMGFGLFD